jgi:hypothetical protein
MINARELRVGNLVRATNDAVPYPYKIFPQEIVNAYADPSRFDPIKIDETVLQKCGFDMNPSWDKYDGCIAVLDCGYLYIAMGVMGGVTLFQNNHLSTGVNFDYLHELQNMYFALTGAELTYTLKGNKPTNPDDLTPLNESYTSIDLKEEEVLRLIKNKK